MKRTAYPPVSYTHLDVYKRQAYKAGMCFPFQLVEEVPAEPFDIRMDEIITQ